jgi:hypothetical protein
MNMVFKPQARRTISRRDFLKIVGITAGSVLLPACSRESAKTTTSSQLTLVSPSEIPAIANTLVPNSTATLYPTDTAAPTTTPIPTDTPFPTDTPTPTEIPTITQTPTLNATATQRALETQLAQVTAQAVLAQRAEFNQQFTEAGIVFPELLQSPGYRGVLRISQALAEGAGVKEWKYQPGDANSYLVNPLLPFALRQIYSQNNSVFKPLKDGIESHVANGEKDVTQMWDLAPALENIIKSGNMVSFTITNFPPEHYIKVGVLSETPSKYYNTISGDIQDVSISCVKMEEFDQYMSLQGGPQTNEVLVLTKAHDSMGGLDLDHSKLLYIIRGTTLHIIVASLDVYNNKPYYVGHDPNGWDATFPLSPATYDNRIYGFALPLYGTAYLPAALGGFTVEDVKSWAPGVFRRYADLALFPIYLSVQTKFTP